MIFQKYLQYMMIKENLRQVDLLSKLQLYHSVFKKLDCITINRWYKNKTEPSFYKQVLISSCLEKNLSYFIQHIVIPEEQNLSIKTWQAIFNKIEEPYHRIRYTFEDKSPSKLFMYNLSTKKHRNIFGEFYSQMKVYKHIFDKINENHKELYTRSFIIKKGEQIISHLSFNEDITQLTPYFRQKLLFTPQQKSIVINVGYYSSKEDYKLLIGHMFNYILNFHSTVQECYIAVRGLDFLFAWEQLSGKLILSAQESRRIGNVHLIKFDLNLLLSHPFIFRIIQQTHESSQHLNEHLVIQLPIFERI